MATKKKGLAANRQRRRTRKIANPPIAQDLTHFILPGFAAYGATRLLSRIVYSVIQKRWPKLGKHAGALAAVGAFGGSWFLAHRIKRLEGYHDAIVVGSGIAALQTVVRTYVPKYGWVVSDYKPEDLGPTAPPKQLESREDEVAAAAGEFAGDEFSYLEAELEAIEAADARKHAMPAPQVSYEAAASSNDEITEEEMAALLGDDDGGGDYSGYAN
ncbi:MAG: hypothetical protein KJO40_18265 [Deltaproteobacteria bacterium]|nr:hypothetical protein [Deltaproteobacteria bacterium]